MEKVIDLGSGTVAEFDGNEVKLSIDNDPNWQLVLTLRQVTKLCEGIRTETHKRGEE